MKRAIGLVISALLIISMLTGCGVDRRVLKAHETQDKTLAKVQENHGILHAEERKLLKKEAEDHIDTKFEWQAEKVQATAAANLNIGAPQIVAEMKRLTYKRDEERAKVAKTVQTLAMLQNVPDNDLSTARQINAKLKEYAAEPGFDFIALVQGFLNKPEDPLPEAKAETIVIPPPAFGVGSGGKPPVIEETK